MSRRRSSASPGGVALLALLLLLLAACGPAYRGAPLYGAFDSVDPQLEQGQRAFAEYCQQCHPGGAAGLAPGINDKPLPGALIRYQVRNGLGAMPAFSKEEIPDDELDAIVEFLLVLRGRDVRGGGE